jgi:hypothetical protein
MQTFKVNRTSWHYKMLAKHDPNPWPQDFCSYWRRVLFVGAMLAFFATVGLVIAVGLLFLIGYWLYLAVVAPIEAVKIAGILLAILSFASLPWVVSKLLKRFAKSRSVNAKPVQPSIFMAKYRSWKHKYCPGIEYTE